MFINRDSVEAGRTVECRPYFFIFFEGPIKFGGGAHKYVSPLPTGHCMCKVVSKFELSCCHSCSA